MVHLIADTREQKPTAAINAYRPKIEWRELLVGDYACSEGCCGMERKEDDFNNMRDVLLKVSELCDNYLYPYIVVTHRGPEWVDQGGNRAYAPRMALLSSLAVQDVGPVIWCPSYEYMLDIMHMIIKKNHDGKDRSAARFNHVRRINHKDIQQNILCSIPGIGPKKAKAIIEKFGSVANFVSAEKEAIMSVDGISIKTCGQILDALYKES